MPTAVAEATAGSPPATECGQIRGVSNLLFGRASLAQPALGSPPLGNPGGGASMRPRLETYAKRYRFRPIVITQIGRS